jgi:hypothetical protein
VRVVLNVQEVENAIQTKRSPSYEKINLHIDSKIGNIITSLAGVPQTVHRSLSNLAIEYFHLCTIVESLESNKVANMTSTEWTKHIRYTYDNNQTIISIYDMASDYTYEYVEDPHLFVLTP